METLRRHVSLGVRIITNAGWLLGARDVVEFHHEKFDGTGYLKGLSGKAIPRNARVFAIIDVFDALTSRRPYKEPLPFDEAMAILERGRGTHFDPELLDVFRGIVANLHGQVSACDDAALRRIVRSRVAEHFLLAEEAARG